MGGLWNIILAAGESKRMGFPKMLLPFNGSTMIENVINNVTLSETDFTLVVLGANSEIITDLLKELPVKCCYNDKYKDGMLSSVKCGFINLPSDFEAVLIFPGDQPLITPGVINKVIAAYRLSGKGIIIPVHDNKRGHPLLIDSKYRTEVENIDISDSLRSLSSRFSGDVLEVETDDAGILKDFDTYEEYLNEINQKK